MLRRIGKTARQWMMDRRTYSGFATALQNEALLGEARPEQVVPKAMAAAKRPWETVTPLAAWLNYMQGTSRFNTSFTIGGGEPDLVTSVLAVDGTVLICWEHDNIMPNIMGAIHAKVPISNYAAIPDPFPNVFFLVWILNLSDSGLSYAWTSVNQNLLAGNVAS